MALRRPLVLLLAVLLVATACGDDDGEDDASDPTTTAVATESTTTEPATDEGGDDGGEDGSEEGGAAAGDAVTIEGFAFSPATLEVAPGTTVTWTNEDGATHTVTSGTPSDPDGTFDERAESGDTVEVTFDEAGTFDYFCSIHPTMTGEIVVS